MESAEAQYIKSRSQRTSFNSRQLVELEKQYEVSNFLDRTVRMNLATKISLSETQIKSWFQNRRSKDRRLKNGTSSVQMMTPPYSPPENEMQIQKDRGPVYQTGPFQPWRDGPPKHPSAEQMPHYGFLEPISPAGPLPSAEEMQPIHASEFSHPIEQPLLLKVEEPYPMPMQLLVPKQEYDDREVQWVAQELQQGAAAEVLQKMVATELQGDNVQNQHRFSVVIPAANVDVYACQRKILLRHFCSGGIVTVNSA